MKKIFSVLSLVAVLSLATPAFAAPHGGPMGPEMGGRPPIHAGAHHRPNIAPPPPHGHHGGVRIHAGYPRHRHWGGYRTGYWGSNWCDYRLGWCEPCPPPPPPCVPHAGVYFPVGGAGVSIRF